MARSRGKCKICNHTVTVGQTDTPRGIAAEGVMEAIQEHIFKEHCNEDLELIDGDYTDVGNAWVYM